MSRTTRRVLRTELLRGTASPVAAATVVVAGLVMLFNGFDRSPLADQLLALPEAEQLEWMGRYVHAARSCDGDALAEPAEKLR